MEYPAVTQRKKNVNRLLEMIKTYKDKYNLTQILALYSFITGISSWTVWEYYKVLEESGIISVDKNTNKVIKIVELKKSEPTT
jgi:DNA-binding transcriptional regulator YhcF (GntR family)